MEWIKAFVETTTPGAEVVTGVLLLNGITGMEIIDPQERIRHLTETARVWDYADESLLESSSTDAHVVFYVTKDANGEAVLDDIRSSLSSLKSECGIEFGSLDLRLESTDDESWLHEWKKHFKPLHIGDIVIVPEWKKYEPASNEKVFIIDPGSAFGTGQHQTTQLCIRALQERLKPGDRLLDIGCGSGILSIIGLLLGADSVFACDIDPAGAIAATKKNATLNPVDISRLEIHAGDAISDSDLRAKICENKFDVIVANIVADVIIALLPLFKAALKPGGVFIASGIIEERLDDVIEAFVVLGQGFVVLDKSDFEGWRCVVGKIHA